MKDKDFDDIGKRLHDLEADPPKDGWNKIGTSLNAPNQPDKVVWLRRNWWKPLVLLIPLSFYIVYSVQHGKDLKLSASLSRDSSIERSLQQQVEGSSTNTETSDSKNKEDAKENRDAKNEIAGLADEKNPEKNKALSSEKSNINATDEGLKRKQGASTDLVEQEEKMDLQQKPIPPIAAEVTAYDHETKKERSESHEKNDSRNVINEPLPSGEKATPTPEGKSTDTKEVSINEIATGNKTNLEEAITPGKITKRNETANQRLLPVTAQDQSANSLTQSNDSSNTLVSSDKPLPETKINIITDSTFSETSVETEEQDYGQWRITASFTPQYLTGPARPLTNDDVLVTDIDNSRNPPRLGLGFAVGAGKAITPDFYIDAQLSYVEAEQDIYFSYATGKVDTLLAVQQPDQSVLVTPVYDVAIREISSKYGYGGIKLGGTYYFWSTPRRRFNIAAMIGAHYLVSANVKEKRNGNWVSLSNENLNKVNYTLTVGAGYNINLKKGWELMINPALTYYLRKVKSQDLPYDLDQQSFGLNIMLSKTLGRK